MLVGGEAFARRRVAYLLFMLVAVCVPALAWNLAARQGWVAWPSASKGFGLVAGLFAGAVILFEMLLWPRKKLRGKRLGKTRKWLSLHVWLGIVILPLGVIHSGYHFGGFLTTALMVLFLIVILSGVFGTALQQWLPSKMLSDLNRETIAAEIDTVMAQLGDETDGLVETLAVSAKAAEHGQAQGAVVTVDQATAFFHGQLKPYLERGASANAALAARQSARVLFDRLRRAYPPDKAEAITKLEGFCDQRREADRQATLQWWLHSWLLVHVPLSVALTVLLVVHAVVAMKAW